MVTDLRIFIKTLDTASKPGIFYTFKSLFVCRLQMFKHIRSWAYFENFW